MEWVIHCRRQQNMSHEIPIFHQNTISTPPMKLMVVCVGLHTYHEEVVPYFLSHVRGRFEDDGEGEGQLH